MWTLTHFPMYFMEINKVPKNVIENRIKTIYYLKEEIK